jgi:hypothetical protein
MLSPDRIYLRFLKASSDEETARIVPDDVKAQDIGELLHSHQVAYAVLNACRSAKGSTVDSNIALVLPASGLLGCIAMSFNIVGGSVQLFTRAFYGALLLERVPFPQAAMLARRSNESGGPMG